MPRRAVLRSPRSTATMPVPDALQLGHDRPAQGGRPHARQPRRPACARCRDCWRFTPDDVLVNVLPLFHIHGLSFATHLSLLTGCVHASSRTQFHPRRTLDVVGTRHGLHGDPDVLLQLPRAARVPRGGAGLGERPAVHLRLGADPARGAARAGVDPGPAGHQPLRDDRGARHHQPAARRSLAAGLGRAAARRASSCASSHDDGTPAPPGEVGSVQLRGPNLFREYWRRPEATREAFASGWFDTGDLGSRDAAGFLTLVGRKNDLIITNGFNVYPQVVERVINECPGVRESAVLGVPDERRGERVVAAVVRTDDGARPSARSGPTCAERLVDYQRPADDRLRRRPAAQRHGQGAAARAAGPALARSEPA